MNTDSHEFVWIFLKKPPFPFHLCFSVVKSVIRYSRFSFSPAINFPLTHSPTSRKIPFVKIIYNLRRKRAMAKYRVMYWKDIPQSFTVEGDGRTVKKQLSQKIQNKIDAYAMAIGATSTTDYARHYKRGEWIERDGAPEEVAETLLAELEADAAAIEIPRRERETV
jgi:hypothetical protein